MTKPADGTAKARKHITERAHEAFKCDMCAGSGQIMFYGRNFGPCTRCKGAGHDTEAAEKAADFAESERKEAREECARAVCVACRTGARLIHTKDGIFTHEEGRCEASEIWKLGER